MKTMNYLAAAIVALLWTGCSQEEVVNETKGSANTIYATIEGSSRSTVTDAGVFSWKSGDEITLVGENNGNVVRDVYRYSGEGNSFTPPTSTTVESPVVAFYPAHQDHNTTTFCLPSSYGDSNSEYVEDTHAAMMATSPATGNVYAFMHLGGVMRFNIKNVPVGANEFRFISTGMKITGHFPISNEKMIVTKAANTGNPDNIVQIHFKALTEAQDMTFYVPMPTGTYEGYEVAIGLNNDSYIENKSTGVTNTINRRTLLLMPTFTYNGTELVKSDATVGVIDLEDGSAEADIEGDADVVVTSGNDPDAAATLNYAPASNGNSVLSISDGSADGTVSGESKGKVVVETVTGSTVASCDINAPTLSVTLAASEGGTATYTKVTATTANQTLTIGEGVTIEELVINGGNVEISGNVKKIINKVVATATVTKDITLSAPIEIENNNTMLTFDLGTCSVKNANTSDGTDGLIINAGSSLTITGTTGSLETATGGDGFPVIAKGTVVINGGIFKSYVDDQNKGNACIYAKEDGQVTVNGGKFFAGSGEYGYDYVLNVKDADRATASITAYGGTFHNFNPAYCKTEGDPTNFLASECVSLCVDATNNVWKVEKMSESAIGQAFANGGSFTMTQDVYLGQALTVPAGKTLSLSLNCYDITAPNTDALVAEGTLTIAGDENSVVYAGSDSSKTGSVCAVWANGGEVTIKGGHYKVGQDKNGKRNDCIYAGYNAENKGGKITIDNGKFEFVWSNGNRNYANAYNGDQFLLNCADKAINTALITVNGGSFKNYAPSYESVTPSTRTENEIRLGTEKAVYSGDANVTAAHGHGTAEDTWYEVR